MDIIIIEDQNMLRDALVGCLSAESGINVVGCWPGVADFLQQKAGVRFDVAVVDKLLEEGNAIDFIKPLKEANPECRVLIITAYLDEKDVVRVAQHGGSGIVSKDSSVEELLEALKKVMQGKFVLDPRAAEKAFKSKKPLLQEQADVSAKLNPELRKIMGMVILGKRNKEIADEMLCSLSQVKYRLHKIYRILSVKNRAQAIIRGLELGLG